MTETPLSYRQLAALPGIAGLLTAMCLARLGESVFALAIVLLVLQRFHAPGLVGWAAFLAMAPGLLVSPVAGAVLDLWQTDGEGLYEAQRPEIEGPWMRGLYRSQGDGSYLIRTVKPIAYTIPMDGTIGELMNRTNMSHMRPAHIHFAVEAPGYHGLVTHLFESGDEWINDDAVYGVKEPLIVDFKKMPAGSKAPTGEIMNEPFYVVSYDFVLERKAQAAAA